MPKVCAVKISDLKRRITMKRKSTGIVGRQTKKSMLRFLDTHKELMHSHGHTLRTEALDISVLCNYYTKTVQSGNMVRSPDKH